MELGSRYRNFENRIASWAEDDSNIEVVIAIGSQVHIGARVDIWSDIDVMMLVSDPQSLLTDDSWLRRFGEPVCSYVDTTKLDYEWDWTVRRVLFNNGSDIDFSILPIVHLDTVLSVNKDIILKGYRIIFDSTNLIENKIRTMTRERKESTFLTASEVNNIVNDILYHVVWVEKKINRGELWIAVATINNHINNQLLRLIETLNGRNSEFMYKGRYLESRTDQKILDKLGYCFSKYDSIDASSSLNHILELLWMISK